MSAAIITVPNAAKCKFILVKGGTNGGKQDAATAIMEVGSMNYIGCGGSTSFYMGNGFWWGIDFCFLSKTRFSLNNLARNECTNIALTRVIGIY